MNIQSGFAISVLVLVSCFGCGGRSSDVKGVAAASGGASTSGGASGGDGSPGPVSCAPRNADAGAVACAPRNHRPSGTCNAQRGPGTAPQPYAPGMAAKGADGGIACLSDSDCDDGVNGRCFPFEGLLGPGGCSYDECANDSDCPSGAPCVCRTAPSDPSATVCAPTGNCNVDSDCGTAGYCSPSRDACYGTNSYFCHTALDTCVDDTDCSVASGASLAALALCEYDATLEHWACKQLICNPP